MEKNRCFGSIKELAEGYIEQHKKEIDELLNSFKNKPEVDSVIYQTIIQKLDSIVLLKARISVIDGYNKSKKQQING